MSKIFYASQLQHIGFGALMQGAIGLLSGNWWAGYAFACAFFIAREHAQREYWIMATRNIDRKDLGNFVGFTGWTAKSIGDAVWPILVLGAATWGAAKCHLI